MVHDLAAIQQACFPTLAEHERITAAHYRRHIDIFPEGQFAVLTEKGDVVACSTDFRTSIDLEHYQHRYIDVVADNWLTNHDPRGDWLYGADIGVTPEYRGLGLSRLLYQARHDLVRRLNLKGHVAGGMLFGYGAVKRDVPVERYVEDVVQGRRFDPTLSVQLKRGFKVHGIIHDYLDDPGCDNKAAFIVWHNPGYTPSL
jgi:GNAT superfamily N-acetyltransferase